ncbi:MAG: GTP-binding protein [Pseudomonadota bacterium]|nr:GTP-binding protein [Pseudomonadota bacterium]
MRLRVYRARDVTTAMAQVRAELGAEALILSTRRVGEGVELTAALEDALEPAVKALPRDPQREGLLAWHGVPEALVSALLDGDFAELLRARLTFRPLGLAADSAPLLLVGPPGAGKTLTVAKLATRSVLAGHSPLVITADGKRAGATEQLAVFTRLLGLQLIVAHNPLTLARALTRRQAGAPVLVDAPGTDPYCPAQHSELAELANAIGASSALVLPVGYCPAEAADIAARYAESGATALIATRFDLARRLGGILAAADSGLALAEAGHGPGAADGLVPLTPEFLAARLNAPATIRANPHRNAA